MHRGPARKLLGQASVAALLLLSLSAPAQTVYRSVGPGGRVTFSDQPAASGARGGPATAAATATTATPALVELPYELRQTAQRYPVTLFTTSACAPCDSARAMLQSRGIPYVERTVNTPQDGEALKKLSGDMGLPLLTIGRQQLRGFAEADWLQYLEAAGYPAQSLLPRSYRPTAPTPLVPAPAVEVLPAPIDNTPPPVPASPTGPGNPAGIAF